jgi:hypothetical protein
MSNHNYMSVMLNRNYRRAATQHVAICNTGVAAMQQGAAPRAAQQIFAPAETLGFYRFQRLASNLLSVFLRAGDGAMLGRSKSKRSGHRSTDVITKLSTRRKPRCLKV